MAQATIKVSVMTLAKKKRQEALTGYLFMAPVLVIFILFLVIPIFSAIYLSFTDWNGISPVMEKGSFKFVQLDNYSDLLRGYHYDNRPVEQDDGTTANKDVKIKASIRQKDFYTALKNTTYYVLGVVPTQTILALLLAVIVNQRWLRGKGFFRTAFYFPSITSSVVISLIFMWMFQKGGLINTSLDSLIPGYGRHNYVTWLDDPTGIFHMILEKFGVNYKNSQSWASDRYFGLRVWDWISGPSITMLTIMILNTWTTIGTMMVIFLAALQDIPNSIYEAAEIDGANAWQIFRKITVPLLRPQIFFVVTLGLIGCYQVFDQVYVISSGGPSKTTLTVAYMVYNNGFNSSAMGLAAATAILLFIIIFSFTMVQRLFVSEKANI
jgi:multiple sugar transport system permease protein